MRAALRNLFGWRLMSALVAIGAASASAASEDPNEKIDFVKQVQPILAKTCYSCHGPEKQKGGLRLDSKALTMKGGTTGPSLVAGKSKDSLLLERILGQGDGPQMPEKADPLTPAQIGLIRRWIDQGAEWPETASAQGATLKKHWAYVKPVRPEAPTVRDAKWVKNPIDAFVLARIEKEGMTPSPEAPREILLRRLSLDLTGLPPTPAEVDTFMKDTAPDAYDRAVERLLASPHYGENFARKWLDAARYADSDGFNFDRPRSVWMYRDWVINAYNADMPFTQFTTEQLAGDMLPGATDAQRIATGFHRNTMTNDEGGVDKEEARWETLLDRVGTTSTVWMGSTMACAQCHNHKFDPYTQKEFYQFLAFFDNAQETAIEYVSAEQKEQRATLNAEIKKLQETAKTQQPAAAQKTAAQITKLRNQVKATASSSLILKERAETKPATDLRIKGSYSNKGEHVSAGTPAFLTTSEARPSNRLELAKWLTDADHPLVARVTVNRVWEHYFGRGLVETSEDFGTQGTPPTHPELLDWLATEFVAKGGKMKELHRLIVTSAVYRQSSRITKEALQKDPYNKLYARGARFRVDAETVRDIALTASGQLSPKIGGPSVFPIQPAEKGAIANNKGEIKWTVSAGADRYRRGLYTAWRRTNHFASFATFDAPSREFCTVKRSRTNTPLQALCGLNDPALFDAARALARRMMTEGDATSAERIGYGYKLCVGRAADAGIVEKMEVAFKTELERYQQTPDAAKSVVADAKAVDAPEWAAYTLIANVLLNLDATLTRE